MPGVDLITEAQRQERQRREPPKAPRRTGGGGRGFGGGDVQLVVVTGASDAEGDKYLKVWPVEWNDDNEVFTFKGDEAEVSVEPYPGGAAVRDAMYTTWTRHVSAIFPEDGTPIGDLDRVHEMITIGGRRYLRFAVQPFAGPQLQAGTTIAPGCSVPVES